MIAETGLSRWLRRILQSWRSRWSLRNAIVAVFGLAGLICVLTMGGEEVRIALRLDRELIADGEYWRLLSAHFVHLGWPHTILNVSALFLIALLFLGDYSPAQWIVIFVAGIIVIDVGLLLVDELRWYVGFSALAHTVLAAGAVRWIREGYPDGYILAGLLLAKLVYEQLYGPLPTSEATVGGRIAVNSHLYGALGGVLGAIACIVMERQQRKV